MLTRSERLALAIGPVVGLLALCAVTGYAATLRSLARLLEVL